jgi:hypothetical protein
LIKRLKELSNCAIPDIVKTSKSFTIRLLFILIQIAIMGLSVFLSFFGEGYYINKDDIDYFSIMLVVPAAVYLF